MVCPLCKINPKNHSLTFLGEENNILIYYTCPSEALLYFDTQGIIYHYDLVLSQIPDNKEWIWIFDAKNYGMKHMMHPETGIEIAKLISKKYSKNLKSILIKNYSSYVPKIYTIVKPFLNKKIKDIIRFND
jgi:hypothetical protein